MERPREAGRGVRGGGPDDNGGKEVGRWRVANNSQVGHVKNRVCSDLRSTLALWRKIQVYVPHFYFFS